MEKNQMSLPARKEKKSREATTLNGKKPWNKYLLTPLSSHVPPLTEFF